MTEMLRLVFVTWTPVCVYMGVLTDGTTAHVWTGVTASVEERNVKLMMGNVLTAVCQVTKEISAT